MSKQLVLCFAILFFLPGSLHAQAANRLKVDIPFDFLIGSIEFKAGTYTIKPMGVGGDAVLFGSAETKEVAVVPAWARAVDRAEHDSELVFRASSGRYALWQIWTEGYSEGLEFYVHVNKAQDGSSPDSHLVVIKASPMGP